MKGYKFRLIPSKEDIDYFMKCFGCSRKIYNIYVNQLYDYLEGKKYQNGLIKDFKFPTPAKIKDEYLYLKEIDSLVLANTQLDFKYALSKFNKESDKKTYKKKAKKKEKTIGKEVTFRDLKGMPTFKSKKDSRQSFTTNNQHGTISIVGENSIKIPKRKTPIKFIRHRELPNDYVIKNVTISKQHNKYYISIAILYDCNNEKIEPKKIVGLDYSQSGFYVSSDGEIANYPHYYRESESKLIKEQRKLSKMEMKSNNWIKQKYRVSKLQEKIANQRKDWLHKKSYELVEKYDAIIFEDIDLRNIAQCLSLGKTLNDNGFGMFRSYVKYKLEDRNKYFIKIDKWFPSSKRCHKCGYLHKELKLEDRIWVCPNCQEEHDRDYNASINIRNEGMKKLNII